ncbi:MAG: cyclic nucleotide-binding domain-containing protein [Bryobacteraceae bacterium]|jgi:CRP-like cAMP-binding protein
MAQVEGLQSHEFTSGLTQEQVATLASMARPVEFLPDELILMDGQRSTAFYLVISGSVSVELCAPQYTVVVEALGAGRAFGWSSLLDWHDTLFQVRAREHTTALRLEGHALKELCRTDPALGVEILRRTLAVVAGRVKATEIRFAEMCGVRVPGLRPRGHAIRLVDSSMVS